jgi:hypothetical protein
VIDRPATPVTLSRQWGFAWVTLCAALALHVADEASSDFLALWNPLVESIRDRLPWLPLPTFSFGAWLTGLVVVIATLTALSRFVFRGARWVRPLATVLGVLMVGNGLGHLAASVWLSRPAPGVWSSPLLIVAAGYLLSVTRQRPGQRLRESPPSAS